VCGIFGVVNLDGAPADVGVAADMSRIMTHRGPDDHGHHADGPVLIGMNRLSIIDLGGGHQPLVSDDGKLVLVCNGEIYNYRELRSELKARGCRFRTDSDSEVVLHAYAEYGDDAVTRLNGMFAFALWDARRRRLVVARDRLGVKPLYVARSARRIAFASEAKALLTLPGVGAAIDPVALDSYLQLGYVPAPHSMFAGIAKLPPATVMTVEGGRAEERRYWRLPHETDRVRSEAQWIDAVRAQLETSTRMQMVSDVPIGAFLSGGIDSSAVVAFMSRHSAHPVKTYSIGFDGGAADAFYNELPYAREVATRFGTDHHEILVRPDVVSLLPKLLWHMDEPIADTAFVTTYHVSEFARRDVTVILSGVGGDELFGGYRRYLGEHYARRFRRIPGWARRIAAGAARRLPSDRHSPWLNRFRYAKRFLESAELPFEERYLAYVEVCDARARDALRARRPGAPGPEAIARAFAAAAGDDGLNRMFAVDAETQLPDDLLLLTDKMSMAVSLECRVPLLDHELVELAAAMPEAIKMRGGTLKYAMKKSLEGVLPDSILHREKRGFGTPMGAWLRHELAPMLRDLLSPASLANRGLFDPAAVERLMAEHASGREDRTEPLIALMNLEIWARVYLDRRADDDVADELKRIAA
jgi:asparagine synthase (glutamine-hydrolysing)